MIIKYIISSLLYNDDSINDNNIIISGNNGNNGGLTVFKFVAITGSIAFLMFGVGYMLNGLGHTLKPVSDIIDELHDSTENYENTHLYNDIHNNHNNYARKTRGIMNEKD